MIKPSVSLLDLVFLKENVSDPPLLKGMIGTVIFIYKSEKLFEVEFVADKRSYASVVLEIYQIEKIPADKFNRIMPITIFEFE